MLRVLLVLPPLPQGGGALNTTRVLCGGATAEPPRKPAEKKRKPTETLRKPFHFSAGNPQRVLINVSGGRSTGTNPLAHSRPLEGLLRQTPLQDNKNEATGQT